MLGVHSFNNQRENVNSIYSERSLKDHEYLAFMLTFHTVTYGRSQSTFVDTSMWFQKLFQYNLKMIGWHHQLHAQEFQQTLVDGEGQGT